MNIETFKKNLAQSGARANLFKVTWDADLPAVEGGSNPAPDSSKFVEFMCKITSLPQSSINPINVNYQGRTIKLAGTRPEYADWTVTVINDESMNIRKSLEAWMHSINSTVENTMSGGPEMKHYKRTASVQAIGKTGDDNLGGYKFFGLFPTQIGEVSLDWGNDALQEYTVTWSFDYFEDLNNSGVEKG